MNDKIALMLNQIEHELANSAAQHEISNLLNQASLIAGFLEASEESTPELLAAARLVRVTPLFDYLTMRIEGLTNTTSEGVSRSANYYNVANLRDDRDFQFLLPGRYRVTMNGQPQFGSLGIRPQGLRPGP